MCLCGRGFARCIFFIISQAGLLGNIKLEGFGVFALQRRGGFRAGAGLQKKSKK